jgi:hypothetical protein
MKKADIHKIIREELLNHRLEEGIINWMLDKAENFVKRGIDSKTEFTLARMYNDPKFRALSRNYSMSEREFVNRAKDMIRKDPKKFEAILAYDAGKSDLRKFNIW